MTSDPVFLSQHDVLKIHARQVRLFGGANGLLSEHALSSAVHAPQQTYLYVPGCSLFTLAASYAFHLGKGHAFRDGNKRVAIACAINFLEQNGWIVTRDQTANVLALVTDGLSEARFSDEFERGSRRTLRKWFLDFLDLFTVASRHKRTGGDDKS